LGWLTVDHIQDWPDDKKNSRAEVVRARPALQTHSGISGTKTHTAPAFGGRGIQVQFHVLLMLESFRPSRSARNRPHSWPNVKPPVEELVLGFEDRCFTCQTGSV
jgi:hypothetical protein